MDVPIHSKDDTALVAWLSRLCLPKSIPINRLEKLLKVNEQELFVTILRTPCRSAGYSATASGGFGDT
jgi:hypothetical protein